MQAVNLLPVSVGRSKAPVLSLPVFAAAAVPVVAGLLVAIGYASAHTTVADRQAELAAARVTLDQLAVPAAKANGASPVASAVAARSAAVRDVLGKRMADWLRIGVCAWHSFAWDGRDMFGLGTLDRPWLDAAADPMAAARQKMDAAFEFFTKLGIPYYCFHDRDVAPDGATYAETSANLDALLTPGLRA